MKKLFYSLMLLCLLFEVTTSFATTIESWQTSQGARVYFVAAPQIPIIDINIAFDTGSARDNNQYGLATLTNKILSENHSDIAFNDSGAKFNSYVQRDMSVFSLRSLSNQNILQANINLLARKISDLEITNEFPQQKKSLLNLIQERQTMPSALAGDTFFATLYGNHPYAHPVLGTSAGITSIQPKDIQVFYQRYYVARNATLAIVGNLTRAQAENYAEQLMKNIKSGTATLKLAMPTPMAQAVEKKLSVNAAQTIIKIGQLGIDQSNSDVYALQIAEQILNQRLSNELRGKLALTYSVYGSFTLLEVPGPFIVSLQTSPQNTKQVLQIMQRLLQQFITQGPSEIEIQQAQAEIIASEPFIFSSNRAIADLLLNMGFYQQPVDYYQNYIKKIKNVTPMQVKQAIKKYLDAKKMLTVVVG